MGMGCVYRRVVMYVEAWCHSWWHASSEVGDLSLVVPIIIIINKSLFKAGVYTVLPGINLDRFFHL